MDLKTGELTDVTAAWTWDTELRAWVGPNGGLNESFMRLPPFGRNELDEFARTHRSKTDGR